MSSNSEIVVAFVDAWNRCDWDGLEAFFSDDVVYHNIPMEPANGKTAAMAIIRNMQPASCDWEIVNIAENGNVVLTERVDNFVMADGRRVSLPVMGTMVIEDAKISVWRDYFDLASFTSQLA